VQIAEDSHSLVFVEVTSEMIAFTAFDTAGSKEAKAFGVTIIIDKVSIEKFNDAYVVLIR